MPTCYFFHIYQDGFLIRDEEGTLCDGIDCARDEAKASAKDLAAQAIKRGESLSSICLEIQDSRGRVVESLSLEEIAENPRDPQFGIACHSNQQRGEMH